MTIKEKIEENISKLNKFYGNMFECGDYEELESMFRQSLTSIALYVMDEMRVEKENVRINGEEYLSRIKNGNYDDLFDYGFALAVQDLDQKRTELKKLLK